MKKLLAAIFALIIFVIPCLNACGQANEELPYVVISRANVLLTVGDEYTLNAKVYPEKYSDLEIEWTTSNSAIVTCDDGKIKAQAPGSAVVMASHILPKMKKGEISNILFYGTGAMMSPSSLKQGMPIPAVAHLLHLRSPEAGVR